MKLAWATDVHFDFVDAEEVQALCAQVRAEGAEALLLGGDIAVADSIAFWINTLADELRMPVYFVLGNHDYYGGSIASVHASVSALAPPCTWLARAEPLELAPGLGLVGEGGWGDTRVGDFLNSPVVLNDYVKIEELAAARLDRARLVPILRDLGQAAADALRPRLAAAAQRFERVLVLTHVPPWRAACWHEGEVSNDDWAPGFVCGAVGAALEEAAAAAPQVEWTVFCGHTHSSGVAQIAPNLRALTQGADYRRPRALVFETDALEAFSPLAAPRHLS